ncbi:MAG: hypothetical protein HY673_25800 [Chloroflexi bacterium]|nr:hypothetical protein [Chloroflexota bacterium]
MGFPAEAPTVLEFPLEMFLPGSDLTPLDRNIDRIIYALTEWQPAVSKKGIVAPPRVVVEGHDYQDAIARMNHLFLRHLWGDGLPLLPATQAQINNILRGSDLPPDTVIGKILPRGGIATVRMLAVCLAMTGGRPEYLPVLIAAVKAFVAPALRHQSVQATTCSICPVVIVNGPVARQIRLNSGYGALGPDPAHPSGASIGRALRLVQLNLGGAIPGSGTMSIYGGAFRYANVVFAEDEAGLPAGWEPLNVSYWGGKRGTNCVTVFAANSGNNVGGGGAELTREGVLSVLYRLAGFLRAPNSNYFSSGSYAEGCPGVVLVARGTAHGFASVLNLSKQQVKEFLWQNSKIPLGEMNRVGFGEYLTPKGIEKLGITLEQVTDPFPITRLAKNIMIVVAGGEQSGHSYYMGVGLGPAGPTSATIDLPAKWDELLAEAEADLG